MIDLPALSEATQRVLKLHFEALLESFRLTGDAVGRYAGAGEVNRRNALDKPPGSNSRYLKGWLAANQRAKQECGITSSVEVATRRFNDLAAEYFKLWSASTGYELFAAQLERLKEKVLAEIASIWKQSNMTERWYESVCAPSVNAALSARLKALRDQARYSEMAMLALARVSAGESVGPNPALAAPSVTLPTSGSTNPEVAESTARTAARKTDLDDRDAAYAQYKRTCMETGVKMTEEKLAKLVPNRKWNTRDPIMKWKLGKDRPGDDEQIRSAMRKGPPPP